MGCCASGERALELVEIGHQLFQFRMRVELRPPHQSRDLLDAPIGQEQPDQGATHEPSGTSYPSLHPKALRPPGTAVEARPPIPRLRRPRGRYPGSAAASLEPRLRLDRGGAYG
jgi:hypothetical protein